MLALLILASALGVLSFGDIYYVRPSEPSQGCPGQPCLTIDQYASQLNYSVQESTFYFLSGNHSLHTSFLLKNSFDVTLKGNRDSTVLVQTEVAICFENVSNVTVQGLTLELPGGKFSSAFHISSSSQVYIASLKFLGGLKEVSNIIDSVVGAIYIYHSNATIENCLFHGNTGYSGGAIASNFSTIFLIGNCFIKNRAIKNGGAIWAFKSTLYFSKTPGNIFIQNYVSYYGGAISSIWSTIRNNIGSESRNHCLESVFHTIAADNCSNLQSTWTLCFFNNTAGFAGGAIMAQSMSSLHFLGRILFHSNYADTEGGAIAAIIEVDTVLDGYISFINNKATNEGGAALLGIENSNFDLHGCILFQQNNCTTCYGGGISITGETHLTLSGNVTFEFNWAEMGGGIYLRNSKIILKQNTTVVMSHNEARYYGGALFHMDNINYYQCSFVMCPGYNPGILITLPSCFLNFNFSDISNIEIYSSNNSAGIDGQFLYGGLMDKCRIIDTYGHMRLLYEILEDILHIETNDTSNSNDVSSEAYALCFCTNDTDYDCYKNWTVRTHRGRKFTIHILALSQGNTITAPTILAHLSPTARLELDQEEKDISANCTALSYNMYSTEEEDVLLMYPDESCRDQGLAAAIVDVTFHPCPDAFIQSGDHCVCEERLQHYGAECNIYDTEIYVTQKAGSNFWVRALYLENGTYEGVILSRACPNHYCKVGTINITINNPNAVCDFNHSGMLCGACAVDHSLTFGLSVCKKCKNTYFLISLAFAGAGIAVVVFLTFFRLTVATGMINSIVVYANIVQANKHFFFPNKKTVNILTVFIAWMNLDLGITACFYDGMDFYAQTWLQFAFPVYVWILVGSIIVISRYSSRMTKLIGSNPVAVLATLLLMSYAKIVKNIIEIFSPVQLEFPNGKRLTVWLKDGNVLYLKDKHLFLAVVCSLFTAIFFLPYTLLLLLGYKLYQCSNHKYLRWFMIRIKPLLESYYAPYEARTRCWTGILLLARCALYVVFSFDYVGEADKSILSIVAVFTTLIAAWLSFKIYKNPFVNAIEALVYLNLIVLAVATSKDANSTELVYSLVGMVFSFMIIIILIQFYFQYISASLVWLKVCEKITHFVRACRGRILGTENERAPLVSDSIRNLPTATEIDLREPFLEEVED